MSVSIPLQATRLTPKIIMLLSPMYYDRNVGQVGLSAARPPPPPRRHPIRLMLLRICETAWRGLHVIRESVQELSPKGFFKRVRLRGRNREHETSRISFRHVLSLNSISCVPT